MPSGNRYKPEDIRNAMAVYAASGGREVEVRQELKNVGLGHVKYDTLRGWVSRSRVEEYEQIVREQQAMMPEKTIAKWQTILSNAGSVVTEALRQSIEALERGEIEVKDLMKAAKDAGVLAAVATDKIELLNGRPTARVDDSGNVGDLVRGLASIGVTVVMPGSDGKLIPVNVDAKEAGTD